MSDWHHSTPVAGMGICIFLKKKQFRAIVSIDEFEDKVMYKLIQEFEYDHSDNTVVMSSFIDPITRVLHHMLLEDVV